MNKKNTEGITISNVNELESVDSKFYILNKRKYTKLSTNETWVKNEFVFEPLAKVIGLADYPSLDFFIVKTPLLEWIISESITGMFIYKSNKGDSKALAIENAQKHIKKKVKTEEGLLKVINEQIKETGISPKYRKI